MAAAPVVGILATVLLGATDTSVYTPGAGRQFVGTVTVCNQAAATTFRLSKRKQNAAVGTSNYSHYDTPIGANDSLVGVPCTLYTTDKLSGLSPGTVCVIVEGQEEDIE